MEFLFTGYYANSCPKPPALKNGVIKASRYSVGSVIKYICNDGYILRGSSIRRCLSSRKWSNRAPTCSRGIPVTHFNYIVWTMPLYFHSVVRARLCPYLNNPENGYINQLEGRKIGAKVWYFCNNGYILVGRESRTCQRNLKWSSNKPICKCKLFFIIVFCCLLLFIVCCYLLLLFVVAAMICLLIFL